MTPEPIFDLAHLGHMELLTPKPDESLKFFVDVMGMTVSGRKGESVYLRGWDDYERYSLEADGVEDLGHGAHGAARAQPAGAGAPRRRAEGIRLRHRLDRRRHGAGAGVPLPRSRRPHRRALLRDRMVPGAAGAEAGAEEPGAAVSARAASMSRRLDHLNCLAVDIKANRLFFENYLGCRTDRADRAQRRHGSRDVDDDVEQELRLRLYPRSLRHGAAASTTSPTRSTAARRSCAPPISSSRTASTSRPARTSTRSSRPSSSMSTSPAATASRSPTPAPASSSRPTGSRSSGPRRSARRARPGG